MPARTPFGVTPRRYQSCLAMLIAQYADADTVPLRPLTPIPHVDVLSRVYPFVSGLDTGPCFVATTVWWAGVAI